MQRFRERASDRHYLANRLHLRSEDTAGARKLFERPARDLGDDVIDGGLKRGRRHLGDVVRNLIEGVPNGEPSCDLCDRETCGLRCECRRTRDTRIHFDHDHLAVLGIHGELNIGAARFDADSAHDSKCRITHDLIFVIRKCLCRSDGDGIAGVHTHGVDIFDRANDHAIVSVIAHDLKFVLFPTSDRRLDQNFRDRAGLESIGRNLFKLLHG